MNYKVVTQDFSRNYFSKRKKEKEKFNFWVNSTYLWLIFIIWALLVYYVVTININATQGYNIRELEFEKKNLLMEKERLDVKIAELESLWNIMNEEDMKNMEKIEDVDYIVIKEWVQYVYNY